MKLMYLCLSVIFFVIFASYAMASPRPPVSFLQRPKGIYQLLGLPKDVASLAPSKDFSRHASSSSSSTLRRGKESEKTSHSNIEPNFHPFKFDHNGWGQISSISYEEVPAKKQLNGKLTGTSQGFVYTSYSSVGCSDPIPALVSGLSIGQCINVTDPATPQNQMSLIYSDCEASVSSTSIQQTWYKSSNCDTATFWRIMTLDDHGCVQNDDDDYYAGAYATHTCTTEANVPISKGTYYADYYFGGVDCSMSGLQSFTDYAQGVCAPASWILGPGYSNYSYTAGCNKEYPYLDYLIGYSNTDCSGGESQVIFTTAGVRNGTCTRKASASSEQVTCINYAGGEVIHDDLLNFDDYKIPDDIFENDDKTNDDGGVLSGYLYANFYKGGCGNSEETFSSGISLGVCLQAYSEDGMPQPLYVKLTCNNTGVGAIKSYSDNSCTIATTSTPFTANGVECISTTGSYLMNYGTNYNLFCSNDKVIPDARFNAVQFTGYDNTDDACTGNPSDFYSYNVGQCYTGNNLVSYQVKCDFSTGVTTVYNYEGSVFCTNHGDNVNKYSFGTDKCISTGSRTFDSIDSVLNFNELTYLDKQVNSIEDLPSFMFAKFEEKGLNAFRKKSNQAKESQIEANTLKLKSSLKQSIANLRTSVDEALERRKLESFPPDGLAYSYTYDLAAVPTNGFYLAVAFANTCEITDPSAVQYYALVGSAFGNCMQSADGNSYTLTNCDYATQKIVYTSWASADCSGDVVATESTSVQNTDCLPLDNIYNFTRCYPGLAKLPMSNSAVFKPDGWAITNTFDNSIAVDDVNDDGKSNVCSAQIPSSFFAYVADTPILIQDTAQGSFTYSLSCPSYGGYVGTMENCDEKSPNGQCAILYQYYEDSICRFCGTDDDYYDDYAYYYYYYYYYYYDDAPPTAPLTDSIIASSIAPVVGGNRRLADKAFTKQSKRVSASATDDYDDDYDDDDYDDDYGASCEVQQSNCAFYGMNPAFDDDYAPTDDTNNADGFLVGSFYSSMDCSGSLTHTYGLALNKCFASTSVSHGPSALQFTCDTSGRIFVQSYSSSSCAGDYSAATLYEVTGQCLPNQMGFGGSVLYSCETRNFDVSSDSYSFYNMATYTTFDDTTCAASNSENVEQFSSVPLGECVSFSSDSSMIFSGCNGSDPIQNLYNGPGCNVADFNKTQILSSSCVPETDDDDTHNDDTPLYSQYSTFACAVENFTYPDSFLFSNMMPQCIKVTDDDDDDDDDDYYDDVYYDDVASDSTASQAKLSGGAIAGIVIASVAVVSAISFGAYKFVFVNAQSSGGGGIEVKTLKGDTENPLSAATGRKDVASDL